MENAVLNLFATETPKEEKKEKKKQKKKQKRKEEKKKRKREDGEEGEKMIGKVSILNKIQDLF